MWQGDITQVVFHVATLMPTDPDDANSINKKLHIANDHVTIVYNDSDIPFDRKWLAGAVNFVYVAFCVDFCSVGSFTCAVL
jgi:tuberous sclerosis protein 2